MSISAATRRGLRELEQPDARSAVQLLTTVAGLAAGWVLTDRALDVSLPLGVAASLVIAVFTLRAFILFHDCGHGSFSRSRRVNAVVGGLLGLAVCTPYGYWSRAHGRHHATSGDLDRRGTGDVWVLTVEEFRAAGLGRQLLFRIYHTPLFLVTVAPLLKFLVIERLVVSARSTRRRVKATLHLTNLALLATVVLMCSWLGVGRFAFVQGLVIVFAGAPAVFLFVVQHTFDGTYWRRAPDWDYQEAALAGSSRLLLPAPLEWVSGHIGYHHLHHLAPRIPNYRLVECQQRFPELQPGRVLTIREGWASLRCALWDEASGRYVPCRDAARRSPAGGPSAARRVSA